MNKILSIIWKDAVLRFTSPSELLFFLVLPLIFTFLLAGGTPGQDVDTRVRMLVVDQAQSSLSYEIVAALEESTSVRIEQMELKDAENQFNERQVAAVLVIPAGLDTTDLQDANSQSSVRLMQMPNNLNAQVAERAVQVALQRASSAVQIASASAQFAESVQPFAAAAERQVYFDQALNKAQEAMRQAPQRLSVRIGATADQIEYDPTANSSAGQLITWVFIPLLGISAMFAYERQQGTLRRLLTTPTSRAIYLLGAILGQVLVSLAQMVLLIAFGVLVMKLNWARDLAGLAVIMVSFSLAAAALGTALGAFVKTEGQATGLSIMLGMVMALLGGCWYPLELFPEFVRNIVKILPTTWAMQGMLDLVLRGRGLVDILPEAGVLLGFAALFFVVGILRFRYE